MRELVSAASVRISAAGQREISNMLAHRAVARDAYAGNEVQILPREFERGHDSDIGSAGCQFDPRRRKAGGNPSRIIRAAGREAYPTPEEWC